MAERLSAPFEFAGEVIRARLTVNVDELERRRGGSLALPDAAGLEALFILPHGVALAPSTLPRWAHAELLDQPRSVIERSLSGLRRVYEPVCFVHEVVIADRSLPVHEQVERLRWLAAVSPCTVVIDRNTDPATVAAGSLAFCGLAVASESGEWVPDRAAPVRRVRSTSQRWLLAERAWASLSSSAGVRSPRP
ncbi:MAG: hypothetical protein ABL966_01735 [Acidimicrobiales bacterium]